MEEKTHLRTNKKLARTREQLTTRNRTMSVITAPGVPGCPK